MFGKFFDKKETATRKLDHPKDLRQGDLITLKPRSVLPSVLEGATLTVKSVCTYEYSDGLVTEFSLENGNGKMFSMTSESGDDGDILFFARKLSHQEISTLFDETQLSGLWGEEFGVLHINATTEDLKSWLPLSYRQIIKDSTAYFYDEDRRGNEASEFVEDGAQELRYHECEGDDDDRFSMSIEVWEDGDTDIYVQVAVPANVIEEMWPNAD